MQHSTNGLQDRISRLEAKVDQLTYAHNKRIARIEIMIDKGVKGVATLWIGGLIVAVIGYMHNMRASIENWFHDGG